MLMHPISSETYLMSAPALDIVGGDQTKEEQL